MVLYWLYRTHVYSWRNQSVQAKLISPPTHQRSQFDCGYGFISPRQDEPYGLDLVLTYQVNPKQSHPDNYYDSAGFSLFSKRLVELMQTFEVKAEVFPVRMVDNTGTVLSELNYFIFHSLEGVLPAMNDIESGWTGDYRIGIPRLVLDESKFAHRPIFKCNHIYVPLMRDDLKQAIQNHGITGFDFLALEKYRSGKHGTVTKYDD